MGRIWVAAGFAALCLLESLNARAFIPTMSPNGMGVRWKNAKLNLAGNPTNRGSLTPEAFFNSVVRGLQRWQSGSEGRLNFDYWQGTDTKIYEPNSNYNGLSSIYFASNSNSTARMDPNVLGLTQVWYNTDTGEILETDIVLNDLSFNFTENPQDTSGYGGAIGGGTRNVFIENVITHELGHAFGLSHSGGLQSTMLFMESPEQAHLGCDELSAMGAIYPGGDSRARGNIQGSVVSESGARIFGAHVVAISRRRGTVLATALTDKQGRYTIGGLEYGDYFLMVEPYYAGSSALPSFYSGISSYVCASETFGRTVLTDAAGLRPLDVMVGAGATATAPTIVARCGTSGGAAVSADTASRSQSSAPVIFSGGSGFGAVDRYPGSGAVYYRLNSLSGHVEVHAMAYSLYSPLHPTIQLLDSNGSPVPAQVSNYIYAGDSGYVNYDSGLTADGLAPGNYYVGVTGTSMTVSQFPAGPLSLDAIPFLIVTGSVNEAGPPLSETVPFNARCRSEENFASYSSPPGDPPRHSSVTAEKGGGFCGTIDTSGGDSGGPSGPNAAAIAGWLLPWLMMLSLTRIVKLHRRQTAFNV